MKKFLSRIRWLLVNTLAIFRMKRFKRPPASSKVLYFILTDNPYDRYLYILFHLFQINGWAVVIQYKIGFLNKWATSMIINGNDNVSFSWKSPPTNFATFTNDCLRYPLSDFCLSHDYFSGSKKGHFLPMPMVDTFYEKKLYELTSAGAKNDHRNIGVFFAGNFNPKAYSSSELQKYFNCFNRIELLNLINNNFQNEIIKRPYTDLLNSDFRKKILVIDRLYDNVVPQDLCKVMSQANFFICFPGVVMPLCHNAIEAMGFGCIPVLQYPDLFHPPLRDGFNCLIFFDENSLNLSLRKALEMEEDEIISVRKNVIMYYESHLSPTATIENILKLKGEERNLIINAENNSVNYLRNGN